MGRPKKSAAASELPPPPANPCGGDCQAGCVAWLELEALPAGPDLDRALGTPVSQSGDARELRVGAFLTGLKLCAPHAKRRDAILKRGRQ